MKTALVTGASSGIGKGLAKELYSRGFNVYAGARGVDKMQDLAELGINTIKLDVTDQESVDSAIARIKKESGRLDVLFNNAGVLYTSPAIDIDVEDANHCFDVNLFGVMRVVNASIGLLKESKGTIVNTGSVAAFTPFPYAVTYNSSKAALHQYTDILRLELKPFEVKVVLLCVAAVDTNISDGRSISTNSSYYPIEQAVAARSTMAKKSNPMSPKQFARNVVPQVLASNPKRVVWDGRGVWMLWLLSKMPRWFVELWFYYKFHLAKLATILQRKKKGKQAA